jgi:hypothetical protein
MKDTTMLTTIEGIYRSGKIELTELPPGVPDGAAVLVTFLPSGSVNLQDHGIDPEQAAEIRARLASFAEDWDTPEMSLYDDYDNAKPQS